MGYIMGGFRIPGPAGLNATKKLPLGSHRSALSLAPKCSPGPIALTRATNMNGPSVALSYLEIGITNVRGYLSLRKQLDRSFGLSVVFGQSKKGPCIYEFKV